MKSLVVTMPWKRGAGRDLTSSPVISATRTEIRRVRDLPGIAIGGLRIRARWSRNPGSIGMKISPPSDNNE